MSNNSKQIISSICLNINKNISQKRTDIYKRLNDNLDVKLKKSQTEEKYNESIKYNVMFYKVTIRNIELLLSKYIKSGDISNKEKLEIELKRISLNCKQYINKAIQSKGKSFNEYDLKIFLSYKNIESDVLISKLENEYKVLSIYNDVINIFIRKLAEVGQEHILELSSDENIKFIKNEIRNTVNSIVKKTNLDKIKEVDNSKEIEEDFIPLNILEVKYLDSLDNLDEDKLLSIMDKEYKVLCVREEMDFMEAYGFGKDSIRDYIGSIVLLDFANVKQKDLIEGGIRLLINGEFGSINFGDYIEHLAVELFNIGVDVWNEGNKIISKKLKKAVNHPLSKKITKEYRSDIDLQEYVYMIENADKSVKFRKDEPIYVEK